MIDYGAMDSKADDYDLYREFSRQRQIKLVTYCREHKNKSEKRRQMVAGVQQSQHQQIYKERGYRIGQIQGIIEVISGLGRSWVRGNNNN
jgi:hypothetical protein